MVMQTKIEPAFVLFFDCPEEEMERRLLSRNQVRQLWSLSLSLSAGVNILPQFNCIFPEVFPLKSEFSLFLFFFCVMKGREDDNIETIRKRFKVFLESSLPVIEHYTAREKVRKVIFS